MKTLCLACVVLLIGGCSGPSYCERRLVPINGPGAARSSTPDRRPLKRDMNRGAEHPDHHS